MRPLPTRPLAFAPQHSLRLWNLILPVRLQHHAGARLKHTRPPEALERRPRLRPTIRWIGEDHRTACQLARPIGTCPQQRPATR